MPREGEVDGKDYHFVQRSYLETAISLEGGRLFFDVSSAHMNLQATSVTAVERVRSSGKICILDADLATVAKLKETALICKYLFIAPSSPEELERRLRGINQETVVKILARVEAARQELDYARRVTDAYDSIIVSGTISETLRRVADKLQRWYPEMDFSVQD